MDSHGTSVGCRYVKPPSINHTTRFFQTEPPVQNIPNQNNHDDRQSQHLHPRPVPHGPLRRAMPTYRPGPMGNPRHRPVERSTLHGPAQPLPRHFRPRRGQPQVAQRLLRRSAAPDRVAYMDIGACLFGDGGSDGGGGEGL